MKGERRLRSDHFGFRFRFRNHTLWTDPQTDALQAAQERMAVAGGDDEG